MHTFISVVIALNLMLSAMSASACTCMSDQLSRCESLKRSELLVYATIVNKTAIVDDGFPLLPNGEVDSQSIRNTYDAFVHDVFINTYEGEGLQIGSRETIRFEAAFAQNLCGIDLRVEVDYAIDLFYYSRRGMSTNL